MPDNTNTPTIAYLTAASAVMYEWINPTDSNLTPDAEVFVWNLPASSNLGGGAVEIEFDHWCSTNDSGSGAPAGATPSFTWNEYMYTYTDTCASFNGYDLLLNGAGVIIGYVDLSNVTHFASSAPGWQVAISTATTNNAVGVGALASDTSGYFNTAVGYGALFSNSTGANNIAFGSNALYSNTVGKGNVAQGVNALYYNTTGIRNLGIGNNALHGSSTGSYNIALGFDAGYNVTTGSNNIEIGTPGASNDNGTIQIGVQGTQVLTTIAGIFGTQIAGSAVYVTSNGQLGVQGSSERFKTDIAAMPDASAKLEQLRPVTFHYKTDAKSVRQYGLIAEEVAEVYPELVIRDNSGEIQGVHYEELAPILLREVQQQHRELESQIRQLTAQHEDLLAERALRMKLVAQVTAQESMDAARDTELGALKQELAELQHAYRAMQGSGGNSGEFGHSLRRFEQ